jgi:MoaA/NifB/PqqE/SkfB family radical SAM enzyme
LPISDWQRLLTSDWPAILRLTIGKLESHMTTEAMFRAEIEATNHCNIRCLHCPHEAITRPKGRMDWATYETIVQKIRIYTRGERFALSFSGMGEPLLNPLIYRFISLVSPYAFTSFASNGSTLNEANIRHLIDAGLDVIFFSFNGNEPQVFSQMMGGLAYDTVLANLRRAVRLCQGTRLKIQANVSITKANQHRIPHIAELLENEGVTPVTYSLCHSRGGNLHDKSVCDTPPMPVERWSCDVMRNTLFIDWRGKAFICDHDIHGEYGLGDLLDEPLETILARRQQLLDQGLSFKICRECNDIMRIGDTPIFENGAGGIFRDWIFDLYKDTDDPLSEATAPFRWIYKIYEKEGRIDLLVNRLLKIEKSLQAEKAAVQAEIAAVRRSKTWRIYYALNRLRARLKPWVRVRADEPTASKSRGPV